MFCFPSPKEQTNMKMRKIHRTCKHDRKRKRPKIEKKKSYAARKKKKKQRKTGVCKSSISSREEVKANCDSHSMNTELPKTFAGGKKKKETLNAELLHRSMAHRTKKKKKEMSVSRREKDRQPDNPGAFDLSKAPKHSDLSIIINQ